MRLTLITAMLLLGAALFAAPVPKEWRTEAMPPPPEPDETLFGNRHPRYGTILAVTENKITLRPMPSSVVTTTILPSGEVVRTLLPVDETPVVGYVHPVMKNGGLADQAAGSNGYRVKDLKVGDIASLDHIIGKDRSWWVVSISIHDRNRKGRPEPFRTEEQWRAISFQRMFAREARLKAKEEAAKNEKK